MCVLLGLSLLVFACPCVRPRALPFFVCVCVCVTFIIHSNSTLVCVCVCVCVCAPCRRSCSRVFAPQGFFPHGGLVQNSDRRAKTKLTTGITKTTCSLTVLRGGQNFRCRLCLQQLCDGSQSETDAAVKVNCARCTGSQRQRPPSNRGCRSRKKTIRSHLMIPQGKQG